MKVRTITVIVATLLVLGGFQIVVGQTQINNVIFSDDQFAFTVGLNDANPPGTFSTDITGLIMQITESTVLGYISALVGFGPRVTGTTACDNAGNYIAGAFSAMGLEVEIQPWSVGAYDGNNIEATLEGSGESDQIFIICAHYDSVSGSPGADDNAAGTAAVMAAAKVMSHYSFAYTVKFLAFSGEEQGLLGSQIYAQEASANGDNIREVLNGDMIGYAETEEGRTHINVYGSGSISYTSQIVCDLFPDLIDLTVVSKSASGNSDHWSFIQQGYDAAMYHEYEFNPYYHSSQDTIDKMDINYDMRVSRLMLGTLALFAGFQPSGDGGGGYFIPPVILMENPIDGDYVSGTVNITGMAVDFVGFIKNIMVKINDDDWDYADIIGKDGSKSIWNYEWDTTTLSDGVCRISAVAINRKSVQSGVFSADVIISNKPLTVSIDAPFNGLTFENIQFFSTVSGGIPPYEYFWEFGDDTVSIEPNPIHIYYEIGTYPISLTVADQNDNAVVVGISFTVYSGDLTPPTVKIINPENAIYFSNQKIIPFFTPVIISNIDIQVEAEDDETDIDYVEIFIDNDQKATLKYLPYKWSWTERVLGKYTITAIAYDDAGNDASDEITIWKLF